MQWSSPIRLMIYIRPICPIRLTSCFIWFFRLSSVCILLEKKDKYRKNV